MSNMNTLQAQGLDAKWVINPEGGKITLDQDIEVSTSQF
jgi:hypothetical protein